MYKQQRFDFNQSGDSSIGLPDGPCALTELWSWGHNGLNQLGTNDEIDHIEGYLGKRDLHCLAYELLTV